MRRNWRNMAALPGMRDEGLFSSALARPQNSAAYGDRTDAADLAAAYAFGLARNHPFLDGNKRTAFVVMELFLNLNGWTLDADDAECISIDRIGRRRRLARKESSGLAAIPSSCTNDSVEVRSTNQNQQFPYSACLVMFSSTPTQASVTNRDDPP